MATTPYSRSYASRPDPEREKAAAVNGPVVSRMMTPEERERNKPNIPDKVEVLKLVAAGKSINKIEKEWKLGQGTLVYWIGKWGLKGLKPGRAQQLLDEMKIDGVVKHKSEPALERVESVSVQSNDEIKSLQASVSDLIQQLETERKVKEQLRGCIKGHEQELAAWALRGIDIEAQLEDVIAERDQREQELVDAKQAIDSITADRDNWQTEALVHRGVSDRLHAELQEALQAITELQEERQLLLETIERASADRPAVDNVNRPAHYTAGGIETIDYMRAKMSDDEFTGYCRGNVLKYISRAPQKNGVENYRKAAWYLNRLIGAQ